MTADLGGAKIYLKREDLNHTGAHKINNVLGQALLAKRMGKTRLIAETGAGQHGVATATAAALMGMECVVFMRFLKPCVSGLPVSATRTIVSVRLWDLIRFLPLFVIFRRLFPKKSRSK